MAAKTIAIAIVSASIRVDIFVGDPRNIARFFTRSHPGNASCVY